MNAFLTTQQMQDLINVDRSTVYRMAEDGRLPGVKVGRQWRFPAHRVAEQLGLTPTARQERVAPTRSPRSPSGEVALGELMTPDALQAIADLLGDMFGLMAVATNMDGQPLTTVSNPCGFYKVVAEQPGAEAACLRGWRHLADQPHVAARFVTSHLGFLCARSFVWVDRRPVGMIVVGGMTPDVWPPDAATVDGIARELGVAPDVLTATIHQTYDVDAGEQRWILQVLPQVADLVSQLATARSQLLGRVGAIAELVDRAPDRRAGHPDGPRTSQGGSAS